MSSPSFMQYERDIEVGERVHIQQGQRAIPKLIGQQGSVVEVFRLPKGSCLVRIDDDVNNQREWFFYRDEVAPSAAL